MAEVCDGDLERRLLTEGKGKHCPSLAIAQDGQTCRVSHAADRNTDAVVIEKCGFPDYIWIPHRTPRACRALEPHHKSHPPSLRHSLGQDQLNRVVRSPDEQGRRRGPAGGEPAVVGIALEEGDVGVGGEVGPVAHVAALEAEVETKVREQPVTVVGALRGAGGGGEEAGPEAGGGIAGLALRG
eukprot:406106-Hanusia_phi.AAC.2